MKKRNVYAAMGLALCLAVSATGCGSSASSYDSAAPAAADNYKTQGATSESFAVADSASYDEVAEEVAEPEYEAEESTAEGGSTAEQPVAQNRKLVKRVNLSVETQEFDKLTRHIENKVTELGGYMESANVNNGSAYSEYSGKNAEYTARVPVAKMNELVDDVGENANVVSKNENAEDVTLKYVDNQSRKEALEVEYERLMHLYEQAEDVDTMVTLENRMTEVRYEIESLESTLRTYDNLVDFATIHINVSEVEVYTPEPVKPKSDWERMSEGFVHSLVSIGTGIKNFFIWFVTALPYLVVWGLVIFAIVCVVRAIINEEKREKRRMKRQQKRAQKAAKAAAKRGGKQPVNAPAAPQQQINLNQVAQDRRGQNPNAQNPNANMAGVNNGNPGQNQNGANNGNPGQNQNGANNGNPSQNQNNENKEQK